MSSTKAGAAALLLFILLLTPARLLAQPTGQVESIGFENNYRPDCWTPMIIGVRPDSGKSDQYNITVKQEDLDRDHPIFTRTISLTGNAEGGGVRDQKFRMYFKPQPTGGGLPDATEPNALQTLQDLMQVSLTTTGGKWLSSVPITTTIQSVDPPPGTFAARRGQRLILAVSDGTSAPTWRDYEQSIGLLELPIMVKVRTQLLPESVLGYDAVDAIIWLDADPAELKSGTDEKFRALESYVRRGGMLVICTPADWQKMLGFADMLPVTLEGTDTVQDPEPLRDIARRRAKLGFGQTRDRWDELPGPFTLAKASAKADARVIEWIKWKDGQRTPWLVRRPYGAGQIAWVAQDLGDPAVTRAPQYWPHVWDLVLDLSNDTTIVTAATEDRDKKKYDQAVGADLGRSLLSIELNRKSTLLIVVAVVFFIGYWLFAGPGAYAYLAAKKRTAISWFVFAASAMAATALTVVLVRVTLRGDPDMKHASLVRFAPGEPAVVYSRIGLYIPRDGLQTIELKGMAPGSLATLCAFGIHPHYMAGGKAPIDPGPEYVVNVRDTDSTDPATIRVPYRSTLKKFELDWSGEIGGRIEGTAKLVGPKDKIAGSLTNGTGKRLRNVHIAFGYPDPNAYQEYILYLPSWEPGVTYDLHREFNVGAQEGSFLTLWFEGNDRAPVPGRSNERIKGHLNGYWRWIWTKDLRGPALGDKPIDDSSELRYRASLPLLSFFSRIKPLENVDDPRASRVEMLRRGARRYDVSAALSAGALVIVAEGDPGGEPIPVPLEVEGQRIAGTGSVLYQFVVPLDRSAVANGAEEEDPTTAPTTDRATGPTTQPAR